MLFGGNMTNRIACICLISPLALVSTVSPAWAQAETITATRELLAKQRDAGTLQLGSQRASIKYAYARSTGSGRLITVITAQPIGGSDAKSKPGFDLGLALLELTASGPGHGELSPAAKVRIDGQGAIVTEGATPADTVQLSNVAKK
jgi:hypothetical protein